MGKESTRSVLISGGNGLLGKRLTEILLSRGHNVAVLSRSGSAAGGPVKYYKWSPQNGEIDPEAFAGIDTVIHLAGENIGESRWTAARKKEIISSRVDTAWLLTDHIKKNKLPVKTFITSSAVGYYGSIISEKIFSEDDSAGEDFLGKTCGLWESASRGVEKEGIRWAAVRSGVILSPANPAIKKLTATAFLGLFPVPGGGRQYFPWIHIDDLAGIYCHIAEDESLSGSFNGTSPEHATLLCLVNAIREKKQRFSIAVTVPSFAIRMVMGEMSDIVLKGSRISSQKIIDTGFLFRLASLSDAVKTL